MTHHRPRTLVWLLLVVCVVSLTSPAFAAEPKLVPAEARIDFGHVPQGDPASFEFILRNEGDADLTIDSVKPSCGCTAALASDKVVPPGGEAKISGEVKTAGFQDRINKTITVTSNDPNQPRTTLTVTGVVDVPFHLEPRYLNFGQVNLGEAAEQVAVLTVKDAAKLPITVGEPEVKNEYVKVAIAPQPAADGESPNAFNITVSLADNAPQGVISAPVEIPIEGEATPVRLSLYANIVGPVAIYPQTVSLGLVEIGREVIRNFVVMSPTGVPFEITGVTCDLPGCTTAVSELPNVEGRLRVTVTVDGTGLEPGRVEGAVTVSTTAAGGTVLTARMLGSVQPAGQGPAAQATPPLIFAPPGQRPAAPAPAPATPAAAPATTESPAPAG